MKRSRSFLCSAAIQPAIRELSSRNRYNNSVEQNAEASIRILPASDGGLVNRKHPMVTKGESHRRSYYGFSLASSFYHARQAQHTTRMADCFSTHPLLRW